MKGTRANAHTPKAFTLFYFIFSVARREETRLQLHIYRNKKESAIIIRPGAAARYAFVYSSIYAKGKMHERVYIQRRRREGSRASFALSSLSLSLEDL